MLLVLFLLLLSVSYFLDLSWLMFNHPPITVVDLLLFVLLLLMYVWEFQRLCPWVKNTGPTEAITARHSFVLPIVAVIHTEYDVLFTDL